MQEIKIQIRPGFGAGAIEQVFPAGRIIVGRRLDCDLVLDARHDLASGRHLALESDGSDLVVEDLDSTNGTLLNGAQLDGRVVLAPGDQLVIGRDGLMLMAELVRAEGDLPNTSDGEGRSPAAQPLQALPIRPHRPAPSGGPDRKEAIGLRTMAGLLQVASKRQRRVTLLLMLAALPLAATIFYLLGREAKGAAELEAIRSTTEHLAADALRDRAGDDDFQAVLESVADSVYVLIKRTERAGDSSRIVESGSGTAFSIDGGFLGTNGHVADRFAALAPGETLIARSNAQPPVDLRIVGVKLHPGYAGFRDLLARIRPYDKSSSEILTLPPAYDVALLEIHPDDLEKQAAPLPLASDSQVFALRPGQPVAFVGFPAEGLIRGGTDLVRPSAKTALGSINRVIDPFFGRAEDVSLAHCLEYNIEVVGGASGSPIVDGRGQVVGLINAGDVISKADSARVGIGGTSYGPRADTIRTLVDGRADAAWTKLRPRILGRMQQIFEDGSGEIEEHAGVVGTKMLEIAAASIDLTTDGHYSWTFKGQVEFNKPGVRGIESLEIPSGKKGLRAIVAIANGVPIGFRMVGSTLQDRERLVDRAGTDEPVSTVDARLINPNVAGESIRVDFQSAEDEFFAPGQVSVFVLRVD